MLAFGKDGVLKKDEIVTVANYVRSLSGLPTAAGYDAAPARKFSPITARRATAIPARATGTRRARSHRQDLALRLGRSDADRDHRNGRAGVMPAWVGRLDPATIKALTVFVHSLGGGK